MFNIPAEDMRNSHNQGERCSFLLYRGEKNQKRNSLEVLSIPTSAEVGSGRCPDTPRTFWKKFDQKLIVGHSAANSEYCYRLYHDMMGHKEQYTANEQDMIHKEFFGEARDNDGADQGREYPTS